MDESACSTLPDGTLVSWYGDDYTGAASVMEVLAFSGLSSVLFLDKPTQEQLGRFSGYRGIGIAGAARARPPKWMEDNLPSVFRALAGFAAPVSHYKVCSTFDSSPAIGSIGTAIEIGAPILGGDWHPLLVGAPNIGRYQLFGNLFARADSLHYRLDRHPTMSRHPVTPMGEADVRLHLAKQTDWPIALIDILTLQKRNSEQALRNALADGARIIALDTLDEASLAEAGRLIWENRDNGIFAIGSQGVEYALVAHWRNTGLLDRAEHHAHTSTEKRVVIVSGSCSPVTASQIDWARNNGFTALRLDAGRAVDAVEWEMEIGRSVDAALAALDAGRDPIVFTAEGPDDPATGRFREAIDASGEPADAVNARVGSGLGQVLRGVMQKAGIERGVIAGGDTSSHGTAELGVYALTALAPLAPGAALCRAHVNDQIHGAFEIALKGGQMGDRNFFGLARGGGRI
ncbi:four-carbon acid sugar kinase family protein [Hoeflea sp. CAU 1731]